VVNVVSCKSTPRTVDGKRLIMTRPTPPSWIRVSRDMIRQRQRQMIVLERSRSLDNDRRCYTQATCRGQDNECSPAAGQGPLPPRLRQYDLDTDGAGRPQSDRGNRRLRANLERARVTHCSDRLLNEEDRSHPADCWSQWPQCTEEATASPRFRTSPQHYDLRLRQSELMVNYDDDRQRPSTRTLTADTSLDSMRSAAASFSGDWSPTAEAAQRRRQRPERRPETDSTEKKRTTLSCVLADFGGLLRRMRRLRLATRADRAGHETRV